MSSDIINVKPGPSMQSRSEFNAQSRTHEEAEFEKKPTLFSVHNDAHKVTTITNDIKTSRMVCILTIIVEPILAIAINAGLIIFHETWLHHYVHDDADISILLNAVGNYLNIAAFIYTLVCAELMSAQLNKLAVINANIAREAATLRKGCLVLAMIPFNQKDHYIKSLFVFRDFTFKCIWETMSHKLRLKNINLLGILHIFTQV